MTRRLVLAAAVTELLALDWAALDDITTGSEPSHFAEYAVLVVSLLVLGYLARIIYDIRRRADH